MDQFNILLFVESRYRVDRKRIKSSVVQALKEVGISGPAEVSIAIVGDRKMRELHKTYKKEDRTTNVLSFPTSEGQNMVLPTDTLRLGDVVISYPQVIKEASEEEMLVDDKIEQLVIHGLKHLLGLHHE